MPRACSSGVVTDPLSEQKLWAGTFSPHQIIIPAGVENGEGGRNTNKNSHRRRNKEHNRQLQDTKLEQEEQGTEQATIQQGTKLEQEEQGKEQAAIGYQTRAGGTRNRTGSYRIPHQSRRTKEQNMTAIGQQTIAVRTRNRTGQLQQEEQGTEQDS